MKTEPTINIQDEVSKIHAQYGITEMANYRIEKLFEKHVEQFSPKVKQLEWDGKEELAFFTAQTNIGEYMIDNPHDDKVFVLMYTTDGSDESLVLHTSNSVDELKSFAQQDFEVRIKKCLITE